MVSDNSKKVLNKRKKKSQELGMRLTSTTPNTNKMTNSRRERAVNTAKKMIQAYRGTTYTSSSCINSRKDTVQGILIKMKKRGIKTRWMKWERTMNRNKRTPFKRKLLR